MLIMNKWKIRWVNCGCVSILAIGSLGIVGYALIVIISAANIESGLGAGGHYDSLQRYAAGTPQWSADGQTLVVKLIDGIYGASVDGNRLWRVAYADSRFGRVFEPSLSVSGETAYLKYYKDEGGLLPNPDGHYHIEITDINGVSATTPNRLFSKTGTQGYPKWSPNGSRLAFSANGNMTVMTKREEVGQLSPWARLSSTLTFWRNDDVRRKYDVSVIENRATRRPIVWSNDGQSIAYIDSSVIYNDYTDEYDISVDRIVNMQWDGADEKIAMEQQSRRDEFRPARFEPTSLAWSATDDRIYFVYYELADGEDAGYTPSVRSVRTDGSDERIIALWWEHFRVKGLKVSPDGSQLLFTSYHALTEDDDARWAIAAETDEELYVLKTDGSDVRKVFDPTVKNISSRTIYASWSPDGSRIAVHYLGSGGNVFTIAPDGADARMLIKPNIDGLLVPGRGEPLPEALLDPGR